MFAIMENNVGLVKLIVELIVAIGNLDCLVFDLFETLAFLIVDLFVLL